MRSAAEGKVGLGEAFGVASLRSFSPQAACHAVMSGSGAAGKAVVEMSLGNGSPVSGFFRSQFLTANNM